MNVILHSKDSYTPKCPERCDDYQNHFISRVVFNTDKQLYIVFENSRGTVSDNEIAVYISEYKDDYKWESDYVSTRAIRVSTVEIGVLPVFVNAVDKLVADALAAMEKRIKSEEDNFNETKDAIEKIMAKWFGGGYGIMFRLKEVCAVLKEQYPTAKWWKR